MQFEHQTIIVATHNKGKLKEFKASFKSYNIEIKGLHHYENLPEIIENGETFADNAVIKAKQIGDLLQLPVLADDSGLCVDLIHGRPGVYSARYAGEGASDEMNNAKLLAELKHVRETMNMEANLSHLHQLIASMDRHLLSPAQFVCALVLYFPNSGKMIHAEGTCPGFITELPRGNNGFGYDPLFLIPQFQKTMAELSPSLKLKISHRGEAIRNLIDKLALRDQPIHK